MVVVVPVVGTVPVVGPAQFSSARSSVSSSSDCPGAGMVVSGTAVSGAFAGTIVVGEPPAAAESVGAVEVVGIEAVDGAVVVVVLLDGVDGGHGPVVVVDPPSPTATVGGVVAAGGDADRHADDERGGRAEGGRSRRGGAAGPKRRGGG